jgi:hypothetical protein
VNGREEYVRDGRPPYVARDLKQLRIVRAYARQFFIQRACIRACFVGELEEAPREAIALYRGSMLRRIARESAPALFALPLHGCVAVRWF